MGDHVIQTSIIGESLAGAGAGSTQVPTSISSR